MTCLITIDRQESANSVSELPETWATIPLGSVHIDHSISINPSFYSDELFELYSIPAFSDIKPEIVKGESVGSNKRLIEDKVVLLSKINPRINRVWYVNHKSNLRKICSTEWIPFYKLGGLSPKYLKHFLTQDKFRNFLAQNVSGVGGSLMRIKPQTLKDYQFPLPPLPEQHRIVAKIEELFTRLDAGVAALKKAKALLKQYRQAVLKAAVEGRLTEEWRKEHAGEIEPASVLLERIQAERKQRLGKNYKPPRPIDTSDLPELPEGWAWARVEDAGVNEHNAIVDGPFGSNLKVVDYDPNGHVPVVSITNIDEGFNDKNLRYINYNKFNEIKRSAIKPGDILMAKIGSSYGKCGYYPDNMPIGIIPANMLKVTVSCSINKSYLFHYFKSLSFKRRLDKIMKSTAQPAFNVTTFKSIAVPLPPKKEQDIIVAEVSRLLSIIDESEQIVDAELKRSQSLRQSILKRAFAGKLVPQDSSDEPASVLLERIRKEKKI